jgi:hypothetical protein
MSAARGRKADQEEHSEGRACETGQVHFEPAPRFLADSGFDLLNILPQFLAFGLNALR